MSVVTMQEVGGEGGGSEWSGSRGKYWGMENESPIYCGETVGEI